MLVLMNRAQDLRALQRFQESGLSLHSFLPAEFGGFSFGPLETPGQILFFSSLQFCIYQLVIKAEQHLLGLTNVEVFFFFFNRT